MIKGLIFDLDGTLINSSEDITYSLNLSLTKYGYEKVSEEKAKYYMGRGFRNLIKDVLPLDSDDKILDEITSYYSLVYGNHYMDNTKPYEGVSELLSKLQNMNIKLAANSNKKNEFTCKLMKNLFPNINFVATFGQREDVPIKPDPTSALEIINMMKLNINEVAYVGDSEVDMKTGINAGIKTIGCLWGFRSKKQIEAFNPTIIVSKPNEILDYIKELNNEKSICSC